MTVLAEGTGEWAGRGSVSMLFCQGQFNTHLDRHTHTHTQVDTTQQSLQHPSTVVPEENKLFTEDDSGSFSPLSRTFILERAYVILLTVLFGHDSSLSRPAAAAAAA